MRNKFQEESDQLQLDNEIRNAEEVEYQVKTRGNGAGGGQTSGEESEWIDYTDTNQGRYAIHIKV